MLLTNLITITIQAEHGIGRSTLTNYHICHTQRQDLAPTSNLQVSTFPNNPKRVIDKKVSTDMTDLHTIYYIAFTKATAHPGHHVANI